jgi:hypothetical protein
MREAASFGRRWLIVSVVHGPQAFGVKAKRGFALKTGSAPSFCVRNSHHEIVSDAVGGPTVGQIRDADRISHWLSPSMVVFANTVAGRDSTARALADRYREALVSIIRWHRRSNDVHDVVHQVVRRSVEGDAIQLLEVVEEAADHVVRNVREPHRIDRCRDHVRQCHQRNAVVPPSAFVFHHAEAFAA